MSWERVGSFYFHAKRYNKLRGTYKWVKEMSFSDLLRSPYVNEVERLDEFCADGAVDYFVDYTRLSDWYGSFTKGLGHPESALPTYNVGIASGKDNYRELFSDKDMDLMSQHFAGEIHMLNQMQSLDGGEVRVAIGDK